MGKIVKKIAALILVIVMTLGLVPSIVFAPKQVLAATVDTKVAAGESTNLVLTNGVLYGFGKNTFGELGTGTTGEIYSKPIIIDTSYVNGKIIDVKAGFGHTVILTDTNKIYATGHNGFGQLGTGNKTFTKVFTEITRGLPDKTIKSIEVSRLNTYVIYDDNTIYATGYGKYGHLGLGLNADVTTMSKLNVPLDYKDFVIGNSISAYIGTDNNIYAAGATAYITLGGNYDTPQNTYVKILDLPDGEVPVKLYTHLYGLFALTANGEIYSTGNSSQGALGDGTTNKHYTDWVKVIKPNGVDHWTSMSTTSFNVFGYGNDGKVYGWGYNWSASLGIGNIAFTITKPTPVYYETDPVKTKQFNIPLQMKSSKDNTIAISDSGYIYVWGYGVTAGQEIVSASYGQVNTIGSTTGNIIYVRRAILSSMVLNKNTDEPVFKSDTADKPITITTNYTDDYNGAFKSVTRSAKWFRLSSTDTANYSSIAAFDTKNNSITNTDDKGELTDITDAIEEKFSLDVGTNGRYWIKSTHIDSDGNVINFIKNIVVDNIYVKPDIYIKGTDATNFDLLYSSQKVLDTELPLQYGIAYDIDGTSILSTTADGITIVENNPAGTFARISISPIDKTPIYTLPSAYSLSLGAKVGLSLDKPVPFLYNRDANNWTNITYEGITETNVPLENLFQPDTLIEKLPINTLLTRTPPDIEGYISIGYKIDNSNNPLIQLVDGNAEFTLNATSKKIIYVYKQEDASVSGRVTVAGTKTAQLPNGIPIAGVTVKYTNGDITLIATTNAEGVYKIKVVTPGEYNISIEPNPVDGFLEYNLLEIQNVAGTFIKDIELNTPEGKGVSYVIVIDEDGSPVKGATVTVDGNTYTTGANGKTLAINLAVPGIHNAMVSKENYIPTTKVIELGQNDIYKNITVTLQKGDGTGSVWGYVKDENGIAIEGATVKSLNGLNCQTDESGFYVLNNLPVGENSFVVSATGYETIYDKIEVVEYKFANKNFALKVQAQAQVTYIVYGRVTSSETGQPIIGATVSDGSIRVVTDDFGYYVIGNYSADSNKNFEASKNDFNNKLKTITSINADTVLDFALSPNIDISVRGITYANGAREVLFEYILTEEYNRTKTISITSNLIPQYKIKNPTTGGAFPAFRSETVMLNADKIVEFEYLDNMANVDIKAYVKDTTDMVPGFMQIPIEAEVGYPFDFKTIPNIEGYTYNSYSGKILNVIGDGTDEISLYYIKNENTNAGMFNIIALDNDTNAIIGQIENNSLLNANETFYATDINAPTVNDIPDLEYYTLVENSGTPISTIYNGHNSPVNITYKYENIKRTYVVERWDFEDGVLIDRYNIKQSQPTGIIYTENRPDAPNGYIPLENSDNRAIFKLEPQIDEHVIKFYYTKTTSKTINVKAVFTDGNTETDIPGYNSTLLGKDGTVATATAPNILGYRLSAEAISPVSKIFGIDTEIKFVYVKDLVNIKVEYRKDNMLGNEIAPFRDILVQKGVYSIIPPKNIPGYSLIEPYLYTGAFLSDDTLIFLYTAVENDTVSIKIFGINGQTELYSYTIIKPKNSGIFTVEATDQQGYTLDPATPSPATINTDGTVLSYTFMYNRIDVIPALETQLTVKFTDIDTQETIGEDGVEDLLVGETYTYKYPSLENLGYEFDSSLPVTNSDSIDLELVDGNNEIFVYYKKKKTDITVNHYDNETKELLDSNIITDEKVGTLYTANYYNPEEYYYYSGDRQKLLIDGENVINLYYVKKDIIPNSCIIIEHIDKTTTTILKTEIINDLNSQNIIDTTSIISKPLTDPYEYITENEEAVTSIKNLGYDLNGGDARYEIPIGTGIKIYYTPKMQDVIVDYYDITEAIPSQIGTQFTVPIKLNTLYIPYIKYFNGYYFNSIEPKYGLIVTNGENKVAVNYLKKEKEREPEKIPAILTINYIAKGVVFKSEHINLYFENDNVTHTVQTRLYINNREYSLAFGEENTKSIVLKPGINTLEFLYNDLGRPSVDDDNDDTESGYIAKPKPTVNPPVEKLNLEKLNHIKYINGYPDGTFKSGSTLTRAEAVTIFYNLSNNLDLNKVYSNSYNDVSKESWYFKQIEALSELGIINGYPDGSFRPNENITRAEFITIIAKIKSTIGSFENIYTDVDSGHWASNYITIANKNGWVHGYEDGEFKPNKKITRAEAVTIVNNVLERKITKEEAMKVTNPYSDVYSTHWTYENIIEASVMHEYENLEYGYEKWKSLLGSVK